MNDKLDADRTIEDDRIEKRDEAARIAEQELKAQQAKQEQPKASGTKK